MRHHQQNQQPKQVCRLWVQIMSQLTNGRICVKMGVIFGQSGQFLGNIEHVPSDQVIANITRTSTKPEIATYHHQSLGPPPISSVLRALSRHPDELLTFPGMSKSLINKHLPPATATYKGHMVGKRINQNSTRSNRQAILDARQQIDDMSPK